MKNLSNFIPTNATIDDLLYQELLGSLCLRFQFRVPSPLVLHVVPLNNFLSFLLTYYLDPVIQLIKFSRKSLFSSIFAVNFGPYHPLERLVVMFVKINLFVFFAVKLAPYYPSSQRTQWVFVIYLKIVVLFFMPLNMLGSLDSLLCTMSLLPPFFCNFRQTHGVLVCFFFVAFVEVHGSSYALMHSTTFL